MKFKFSLLGALAAFAVLAVGCNKDVTGGDDNKPRGDESFVSLTIKTQVPDGGNTRAGEKEGQEASAAETAVVATDGVDVVIFDANGQCVYAAHHDLDIVNAADGEYKVADLIEVQSGNLYFCVFANDGADLITLPAVGSYMDAFMTKTLASAYTSDVLDITGNEAKFLLGSLWRQITPVAGGGTTTSPVTVNLPSIGRLASKVLVKESAAGIAVNSDSDLTGEFEAVDYRLGTLAKAINYAGVHADASNTWGIAQLPYGTNTGVLVTSAKHGASFELTPAAGDFNTGDFTDYLTYKALDGTNAFYATENTTGLINGLQYYGNTTYVQIKTVYTPAPAEIYDPVTGDPNATLTDGNFWTGVKNGVRLIYSADPAAVTGISDIKVYEGGENFHKFVVYDPNEDGGSIYRNRVLRNHYYEYTVNSILDLGEPTDIVDPTEPVVEDTTLDLQVTVGDWDKVATEVNL